MIDKVNKVSGKVRSFINRHSMLGEAGGVLVAVSGGPDSMALLDILLRLAEESKEPTSERPLAPDSGLETFTASNHSQMIPPVRLHIAHLNHGLRGRESDMDEEFVRAKAEQFSLSITTGRADVRAAAQASGRSIEEAAREVRYDFLLKTAGKTACDRIATGHTMSDQAETFLMRLARGAGLRGLAAMRPVTPAHFFGNNAILETQEQEARSYPRIPAPLLIRPLLCISRDEVEQYCRDRRLEFRTDATNFDTDYARNQVRHKVLPSLRAINPRAAESIARAAEILACDQDALDQVVGSLLDQAHPDLLDKDEVVYLIEPLLKQPFGLRRRMIIEAIRRERARAKRRGEDRRSEIVSKHIDAVEHLLSEGKSGNHVTLPDRLEVWREFDHLVFRTCGRSERSLEELKYELEIEGERARVEAGGLSITSLRGQPANFLEATIREARQEKERSRRDWMIVVLDDNATPKRLIVRPRLSGERARVLGQRSAKKLKSLMIDHKIPSSRRPIWPVLATQDGLYVWSPGLPPAVEFAARKESSSLAILRASSERFPKKEPENL